MIFVMQASGQSPPEAMNSGKPVGANLQPGETGENFKEVLSKKEAEEAVENNPVAAVAFAAGCAVTLPVEVQTPPEKQPVDAQTSPDLSIQADAVQSAEAAGIKVKPGAESSSENQVMANGEAQSALLVNDQWSDTSDLGKSAVYPGIRETSQPRSDNAEQVQPELTMPAGLQNEVLQQDSAFAKEPSVSAKDQVLPTADEMGTVVSVLFTEQTAEMESSSPSGKAGPVQEASAATKKSVDKAGDAQLPQEHVNGEKQSVVGQVKEEKFQGLPCDALPGTESTSAQPIPGFETTEPKSGEAGTSEPRQKKEDSAVHCEVTAKKPLEPDDASGNEISTEKLAAYQYVQSTHFDSFTRAAAAAGNTDPSFQQIGRNVNQSDLPVQDSVSGVEISTPVPVPAAALEQQTANGTAVQGFVNQKFSDSQEEGVKIKVTSFSAPEKSSGSVDGETSQEGKGAKLKSAETSGLMAESTQKSGAKDEGAFAQASAQSDEGMQPVKTTANPKPAEKTSESASGNEIRFKSEGLHGAVQKGSVENAAPVTPQTAQALDESAAEVTKQTAKVLNESASTKASVAVEHPQTSDLTAAASQGLDHSSRSQSEAINHPEAAALAGVSSLQNAQPDQGVNTPRITPAHIMQIAQEVEQSVQTGKSVIRIQLHPQDLGAIDIHLSSDARGVGITIMTEHASTGRLLESQMDSLRQSLNDAGLNLTQMNFGMKGNGGQNAGQSYQPNSQQANRTWFQRSWRDDSTLKDAVLARQLTLTSSQVDLRV